LTAIFRGLPLGEGKKYDGEKKIRGFCAVSILLSVRERGRGEEGKSAALQDLFPNAISSSLLREGKGGWGPCIGGKGGAKKFPGEDIGNGSAISPEERGGRGGGGGKRIPAGPRTTISRRKRPENQGERGGKKKKGGGKSREGTRRTGETWLIVCGACGKQLLPEGEKKGGENVAKYPLPPELVMTVPWKGEGGKFVIRNGKKKEMDVWDNFP